MISTKRPTVEVASCESDIEIVTINMNNINRIHSTSDASGYSTIGGIILGSLGSLKMG